MQKFGLALLAATQLYVIGCGEEAQERMACSSFCDRARICNVTDPELTFGGPSNCTDSCADQMDLYSDNCSWAYTDLLYCTADLTCAEFKSSNACPVETDDVTLKCDGQL